MKSSDINVSISAAERTWMQNCIYLRADMSRDHYSFNYFVHGHHVYKDEWTPTVGKSFNCMRELLNEKDKNAVAVM